MKTLNNYTDSKISAVLDKHGAFFAFSNAQFEEKRVEGVEYVRNLNGMVIDRKSTRLNSSHLKLSRMPSSA